NSGDVRYAFKAEVNSTGARWIAMRPIWSSRKHVIYAAFRAPGHQWRRRRSFLMISRRSSAYSSMIRRASSNREGWGFEACLPAGGSSDWLVVEQFKANPGAVELNQENVTHLWEFTDPILRTGP
ncbi:hypothetical protein Q2941_51705, partial [Bradyrhizobium sp. UFLA05-153]